MIIWCRLRKDVNQNCLLAEAGDWYVLVVFEKPCIHCPEKQTTVELVVTGAARAAKREVKMTSKVDSIMIMIAQSCRKERESWPTPALHCEEKMGVMGW